MRRALPWIGALAAALALARPGLAQEAGSGPEVTRYFGMFFVIEDLLGQIIVILLLLMSAFSVAYVIKLFVDNRRAVLIPQALYDELQQLLSDQKYRDAVELTSEDPTFLGKLVSGAMNEASSGYGAMERAIEEVSDAETSRRLRPIEYLNVIGNIAPMMGLFGTVYGMIVAFQKLVDAAGRPEPQELAGGISTALVTTFWGLIVAIPALAGYALVRNKVDALTTEGVLLAEELIRPFRPARRGSGGSSSGSSGSRPRATPKPES